MKIKGKCISNHEVKGNASRTSFVSRHRSDEAYKKFASLKVAKNTVASINLKILTRTPSRLTARPSNWGILILFHTFNAFGLFFNTFSASVDCLFRTLWPLFALDYWTKLYLFELLKDLKCIYKLVKVQLYKYIYDIFCASSAVNMYVCLCFRCICFRVHPYRMFQPLFKHTKNNVYAYDCTKYKL